MFTEILKNRLEELTKYKFVILEIKIVNLDFLPAFLKS